MRHGDPGWGQLGGTHVNRLPTNSRGPKALPLGLLAVGVFTVLFASSLFVSRVENLGELTTARRIGVPRFATQSVFKGVKQGRGRAVEQWRRRIATAGPSDAEIVVVDGRSRHRSASS